MKCDICRINESEYRVKVADAYDKYQFKESYRCSDCAKRAERSYEKVTIQKI